jgi:peptidoglycan hydrolase-like protein with peptidoglycan-binding domain
MKNRFLISEEEKSRILGLHEQGVEFKPTDTSYSTNWNNPVQQTNPNVPSQTQPTQQPSSTFKMGVKNDKVTQIQTKLNEKFKAGLTPDGLWGPKTAAAVAKYLPQLKQPVTNTAPNTTTDDETLATN